MLLKRSKSVENGSGPNEPNPLIILLGNKPCLIHHIWPKLLTSMYLSSLLFLSKKLILSINCDSNEINVRIPGRKWSGAQPAKEKFEKSWGTVTWEEVVAQNPEVIIIVNYGSVTAEQKRDFMMSNPAFANIEAVKNDRFVTLEYVEATPGPRNIKAIKTLANAFWGK